MKIASSILLVIVGCFLANPVFAGGMTSSGGEFVTTEKNPWFIGDATVEYCVNISSDFSTELLVAKKIVKDALEDWIQTISSLKPEPTGFMLPDGKKKNLSLNFQLVECNNNPQLSFHLNSFTKNIKQSLKGMARYTAAFTGHLGIDDQTGSTKKGIIWLAPNKDTNKYLGPSIGNDFWSKENILFNVLLHEIGHLFGFEHQDDGVMNDGFPAVAIRYGIQKTTTKRFKYHKWQFLNLKICGKKMELTEDTTRNLLDTHYVIL